jgi:hypothetical protein
VTVLAENSQHRRGLSRWGGHDLICILADLSSDKRLFAVKDDDDMKRVLGCVSWRRNKCDIPPACCAFHESGHRPGERWIGFRERGPDDMCINRAIQGCEYEGPVTGILSACVINDADGGTACGQRRDANLSADRTKFHGKHPTTLDTEDMWLPDRLRQSIFDDCIVPARNGKAVFRRRCNQPF